MSKKVIVPQWLKEVLKRGYKPKKIHRNFENGLFGYIKRFSSRSHLVPDKLIFVLEGIPGSGKTTLLKILGLQDDIKIIPQIFPREPKFDQTESQLFYFKSDEIKTEIALASSKRIILMDRYYSSTLAFYWSFDKIYGTKTFKRALGWYYKSLSLGKLIKPFKVFYIGLPVEVGGARKGRILDDSNQNLWCNEKFLNFFTDFYTYFYANIEKSTNVIRLSGKDSLNSLKTKIRRHIYGK